MSGRGDLEPLVGGGAPRRAPLRPQDQRLLEQYLTHLRVERGLAANTLAAYQRDLTRYLCHLAGADADPAAVEPAQLEDFVRALRTGGDGGAPLAAASTARALAAARGLHAFLDDERASATGDPSRLVPPPAIPRRLPHPLALDQVEALLEEAGAPGTGRDAAPRALRDRALLELLYGTGARISEATGLDVDDVDRPQCAALLRGKGDKQRVVPVGRYALAALEAYLSRGRPTLVARGRGTPAVFLGSRGTRLTRQAAWRIVQGAAHRAQEAGRMAPLSEPIGPHTLRHSYATHLLRGGADVRSVQELLGHASVTTTQLYTQVTVDSLRESHAAAHPRAGRGA